NGGCEEAIIKRIKKAKKSIYFATFVFTNRKIANAIVKKFNEGIKVKGIMEREGLSPYCRYWLFKDIKADVKWDNNFYLLHHKFFIIDDKILITGSYNPTRGAEEKNEENILILESPEICSIYQDEFERLW
ncbi:TPA: phospholipase, partial [bacterium]|nr:phospholipase [bacterium]